MLAWALHETALHGTRPVKPHFSLKSLRGDRGMVTASQYTVAISTLYDPATGTTASLPGSTTTPVGTSGLAGPARGRP